MRDTWDGLDDEVRGVLENAAGWYDENFIDHCNNDIYPNEHWPQVEEEGIEVIEPSDEDTETFHNSAEAVWNHWKGEVGEEVGTRAIALALGEA